MERIEKFLSSQLNITRREAKQRINAGEVTVNGVAIKNAGVKCNPNIDEICCGGTVVSYSKFVYIMMNKPKGVISASSSRDEKTVVDLIPNIMMRKNLFPAGRLDKDTTGFVLITDDGDFAHRILSPKSHVPKTYIAHLSAPFDEDVINAFAKGVELDGKICLDAKLVPLSEDNRVGKVVIKQGMYHQIKRMFKKFGITVLELSRTHIGRVELDCSLSEGDCRYLTDEEYKSLCQADKS